jgi:hypothetical protein
VVFCKAWSSGCAGSIKGSARGDFDADSVTRPSGTMTGPRPQIA